jgi:tRNA modification GTPase
MQQGQGLYDTIAAIITPPGVGGVGIVRLSGPESAAVAERIFVLRTSGTGIARKSHVMRLGWVTAGGEKKDIIDQAFLTFMQAPASYTAEDVVEISCHGGAAVVAAVLKACITNGARLARPGEFTKRAFLNGRIDLAQAEAVADIIQAKSEAFLSVSTHQLKGDLSLEIDAIREDLLDVLVRLEALINFPEEDPRARQDERTHPAVAESLRRIDRLLATASAGRILKEGLKVVLCGRPNVGKSSLLNALLREPRAIVTDVAGTTRDVIEETSNIRGVPVRFADTAGILDPRDKVEEEAVRRSRSSISSADVVLIVLDRSCPLQTGDIDIIKNVKSGHVILVLNKSDLPKAFNDAEALGHFPSAGVVPVSALTRDGLDGLEDKILELACAGTSFKEEALHGIVVSNLRHVEALARGREALVRGLASLKEGASFEFACEDLKAAVRSLDAITGRDMDADVIEEIFSRFCIGK